MVLPAFAWVMINQSFPIPVTRLFSVGAGFIPPVGAMNRAPTSIISPG
jgi:hypothetical protein